MTSCKFHKSNVSSNILLSSTLFKKKFKNNYGNASMENKIKLFYNLNDDPHSNDPYIKKNLKLKDIVEIRIIDTNCCNKNLIGQKGIYTKNNQTLAEDVILGFYNGRRYTINEYESFALKEFENYSISTCHDVVIEPIDHNMILQYINDGRKKVHSKYTSKYFNVEALEVVVDNVPSIVMYTTKKIKSNEQLFFDYGDEYWIRRKKKY